MMNPVSDLTCCLIRRALNDAILTGSADLAAAGGIATDKPAAVAAYMRVTNAPESERESLLQIVQDPRNVYASAPQSTGKFADFLSKTGFLKSRPTSWKTYFFEGLHGARGS